MLLPNSRIQAMELSPYRPHSAGQRPFLHWPLSGAERCQLRQGCCWRSSPVQPLVRCWCGHPFIAISPLAGAMIAISMAGLRSQWRHALFFSFCSRQGLGLAMTATACSPDDRYPARRAAMLTLLNFFLEPGARSRPSLCNLQSTAPAS